MSHVQAVCRGCGCHGNGEKQPLLPHGWPGTRHAPEPPTYAPGSRQGPSPRDTLVLRGDGGEATARSE